MGRDCSGVLEHVANPVGSDILGSVRTYPLKIRGVRAATTRQHASMGDGYFDGSGGTMDCSFYKMKSALAILVLCMTLSVSGQNLLRWHQEPIDPVELKRVYDHYVGSEFAEIAQELAKRVGVNQPHQSHIPQEKLAEPWTHSLSLTLSSAWRFHTDYAALKEPVGKKFEILMAVLENRDVRSGRRLALNEIATRLHWGSYPVTKDGSLPPNSDTIRRLRAIAFNRQEQTELREAIVPILFEHGDPNDYLELAIELASLKSDPLAIAASFRFATPVRISDRLTKENRARYLNYAFRLLESIDNRKSGTGYFLAVHIERFVGVLPVRPGQGSFAPDQTLDEYQGENGLTASFFQKTVDNASEWWMKNKSKYQGEKDGGGQSGGRPGSK